MRALAMRSHAVEEVRSSVPNLFARRRERLSQANVRSTTHRRGRTLEGVGKVSSGRPGWSILLLPINAFRQLLPGIACIGEDVPEPGRAVTGVPENEGRAVAILNVGSMHHGCDQCAAGICENVALPAFDLLACIVP